MLNILVDKGVDDALTRPLLLALHGLDADADLWAVTDSVPLGSTDAVVTIPDNTEHVRARFEFSSHQPHLVVLISSPSVAQSREFLCAGVGAVIDTLVTDAIPQALIVLSTAAGGCTAVPRLHAPQIAGRLDEPPRDLSPEERRLLELAATRTIEAAGRLFGLSRRQAQRRFRSLCDDLGLESHLHAAVAAARWGIVDHGTTSPLEDA